MRAPMNYQRNASSATLMAAIVLAATAVGCNALLTSRDAKGMCGDNVVQPEVGEECDDGNTTAGDNCSPSCIKEVCGNGIQDVKEECDLGKANDNAGDCTLSCTKARCGDGYTKTRGETGLEVCDDGNNVNGDGCNPQCSLRGRVKVIGGTPDGLGVVDGTGSAARFGGIYGSATDGQHLYISDLNACAIRRMTIATGEVKTIAGRPGDCLFSKDGDGVKATFSTNEMPLALVNSDKALYIGEQAIVRKLDLSSSAHRVDTCAQFADKDTIVTALVGTPSGSALFAATTTAIYRMQLPCTCDIYASSGGCELKLIMGGTTHGISDGVGTSATFAVIQDLTFDSTGKTLFVADANTIRTVDLATLKVTTRAGDPQRADHVDGVGAAAKFYVVRGLEYHAGALYAVEQTYNITRYDDTPVVTRFGWSNVRKVDPASWDVTTIAGTYGTVQHDKTSEADGFGPHARFIEAYTASAANGVLYIGQNASIRAVSLATSQVVTAAGVRVKDFSYYQNRAVASRAGNIYAPSWSGDLLEIPVSRARPLRAVGLCSTTSGATHSIDALVFDGPHLYVADRGIQGICRVDFDGKLGKPCCSDCKETCEKVYVTPGGIKSDYARWRPSSLAYDGTNFYITERWQGSVIRIDPKAKTHGALKTATQLPLPWGLLYVKPYLYVSLEHSNQIARVDLGSGAVTRIGDGQPATLDGKGDKAGLCRPLGMASDGTYLYVGEGFCGFPSSSWRGHAIRQLDITQNPPSVTTLVGPGPEAYVIEAAGNRGSVNFPAALTFDKTTRSLYVADMWDNVLLQID
jgi:cysteine-rich repeat protein